MHQAHETQRPGDDRHALMLAILDHLASHPGAADSADGIRRWWLSQHGALPTPQAVEQALAQLVRRGLLRRIVLPEGTVLFGRTGRAGR